MPTLLKLEPALIKYLDDKLKTNPVFLQAVKDKLPRVIMVEAAKACVGFKEKTGNNDGTQIVWVQETYGSAVKEPYCIAGIMTCVAYAVLKTGLAHKLFETESSSALWNNTPKIQQVKFLPLPGAVAVWGDVNITDDSVLGVKTNARSSNWYARIGSDTNNVIVAGCQIHYAVQCNNEPNINRVADYNFHEGQYVDSERPTAIYIAK